MKQNYRLVLHKNAWLGLCVLLGCVATCAAAQGEAKLVAGAATFKSRCAVCHGVDASGNTVLGKRLKVPDLRSREVQMMNNVELKQVIAKGKGNMPEFGDQLTSAEIAEVIKYVRASGNAKK